MKEVRYEFIVKMVTSNRLVDRDAEALALNATENMQVFIGSCGAEIGLDDISMLEGRLYIDGEERCHVGCGVTAVRCVECEVPHNKWTGCPMLNGLVTPPDFFCGFGERRAEGSPPYGEGEK